MSAEVEKISQIFADRSEDQRIAAWHLIAGHPAIKPAYQHDGPLIQGVLERLTALQEAEDALARVIELHAPSHENGVSALYPNKFCLCCGDDYPCRTVQIITKKEA